MSSSIVIHVLRPYANEEAYLASEHFSINSKWMLLIDQSSLPPETPIVFDVQLENGQKPIRAEAKVIEHIAPKGDKPGGLRVRFKRFGAATKAFIDRAVAASAPLSARGASAPASIQPASIQPAAAAMTQPATSLTPEAAQAPAAPAATASGAGALADRREPSGIHRRPIVPVAVPVNREELLQRLRTRAHNVAGQDQRNPSERAG